MERFRTRYVVLAALLAAFIGVSYAVERLNAPRAGRITIWDIPLSLGEWQGEDVPVFDETRAILETDAVMMREYRDGRNAVLLALVYYRDSRVALHMPESCYSGQGSAIVERRKVALGGFSANGFLLEGNKGNKIVLYYYVAGDKATGSYGYMRFQMIKDRIMGRNTGCALVRLTMHRTAAPENDIRTLRGFAREINSILPRYMASQGA